MSTTTLTKEQVEAFKREGFLIIERAFAEDEVAHLQEAADRILELILNSSLARQKRNPRLDSHVEPGRIEVRKVQPVNDLSDAIARVSSDLRLIGPMSELMGDEPVLMEEKLNYKQDVDTGDLDFSFITRTVPDTHFPLHHDWGYFRHQGYPENTISSAVALDDCPGRGPIRILPGSHAVDAPLINPDPASGDGVVEGAFFDGWERRDLDVPAGSVALLHAKLVHDSEPNRSGLPRRIMIYSHYPKSHDPEADPDRRNRPAREYSQTFENEYRQMVERGEVSDYFKAP